QQYHSRIDVLIDDTFKEMIVSLISKCTVVLEGVLSKLSRYDEGTFFSSILSFTVSSRDVEALSSRFSSIYQTVLVAVAPLKIRPLALDKQSHTWWQARVQKS
ncbi:hypothetical protein CHARACLAT_014133, partial [Characodon lateralis]|nr:hypothetical protein [Characodon lateralis]